MKTITNRLASQTAGKQLLRDATYAQLEKRIIGAINQTENDLFTVRGELSRNETAVFLDTFEAELEGVFSATCEITVRLDGTASVVISGEKADWSLNRFNLRLEDKQ